MKEENNFINNCVGECIFSWGQHWLSFGFDQWLNIVILDISTTASSSSGQSCYSALRPWTRTSMPADRSTPCCLWSSLSSHLLWFTAWSGAPSAASAPSWCCSSLMLANNEGQAGRQTVADNTMYWLRLWLLTNDEHWMAGEISDWGLASIWGTCFWWRVWSMMASVWISGVRMVTAPIWSALLQGRPGAAAGWGKVHSGRWWDSAGGGGGH